MDVPCEPNWMAAGRRLRLVKPADGYVQRIDPATNTVAATVPVDKIADQGQIPVAFGQAWVLTGERSTLVGIAEDAVGTEIDLGTRCTELTASETAIWLACPIDGVAVAVDPEHEAVSTRVDGLTDARQISAERRRPGPDPSLYHGIVRGSAERGGEASLRGGIVTTAVCPDAGMTPGVAGPDDGRKSLRVTGLSLPAEAKWTSAEQPGSSPWLYCLPSSRRTCSLSAGILVSPRCARRPPGCCST